MEERRLLLAVALSLLVLTAYQLLFAPAPPARQTGRPGAPAVASPSAPAATLAPSFAPSAAPQAAPAVPPVEQVTDVRERRVEAQGQDVLVAFSNRGARLLSWRLLRYTDVRGRPEEMVPTVREGPRSLDLETGDAALDGRLRAALFRPSAERIELRAGAPGELRFTYAEGDLQAEKVLRFAARGYLVEVVASVRRAGQPIALKVIWGPGVGNQTAAEREVQGFHEPQAVYLASAGVQRVLADKIGGSRAVSPVRWVGVESTYFAALWVPPPGAPAEVRSVTVAAPDETKGRTGVQVAVGLDESEPARLYVGPKDYPVLARADHDLARVVPVGEWIGPIVVPFMALLRWAHSVVGNYGLAIIVLTVLINLAMAPFRHYSIANGLKMARIAPEMRAIQERYRKVPLLDPRRQQMQDEIAALYARHGMSMGTQMAVGCLPLLLTMPFLIAFYRVLQVSIELRGASFLWIPDLSQKDPLFVTPVLMGLSMFLMQRMVPTSMDPAQQRMMMVMPVVLSGMFLWAPGGLNLYWLASNLCSIVQQAITLRVLRRKELPAVSRKERRRA
jgi:YidC/Oxa1 family membrane protein insertase